MRNLGRKWTITSLGVWTILLASFSTVGYFGFHYLLLTSATFRTIFDGALIEGLTDQERLEVTLLKYNSPFLIAGDTNIEKRIRNYKEPSSVHPDVKKFLSGESDELVGFDYAGAIHRKK